MGAFSGRTALVTGASRGIGYHIARNLAQAGAGVVLVARNTELLERAATEIADEYGVPATTLAADLSTMEGIRSLYADATDQGICVDILVNNAGFGLTGAFHENDTATEADIVSVNVMALTELSRAFATGMIERHWGRILNVSSILGFMGSPYMATYAATKAYVLSISYALRGEFSPFGVGVTCVAPGSVETEFHRTAGRMDGAKPMSMAPEEVARVAVRALMKNRGLVVPGLPNKILAFLPRLLPRGVASWITGRILHS
jgi:uncharacterized protein